MFHILPCVPSLTLHYIFHLAFHISPSLTLNSSLTLRSISHLAFHLTLHSIFHLVFNFSLRSISHPAFHLSPCIPYLTLHSISHLAFHLSPCVSYLTLRSISQLAFHLSPGIHDETTVGLMTRFANVEHHIGNFDSKFLHPSPTKHEVSYLNRLCRLGLHDFYPPPPPPPGSPLYTPAGR